MSTAPLGTIGSIVTGQLQQARGADVDRTSQDVGTQSRAVEASRSAENAAGVGEMDQEGETSGRDADGRRLWERPPSKKQTPDTDTPEEETGTPLSRDPSGDAGNQIDLSG